MKKILTLLSTIIFCSLSTMLNCAEEKPISPWVKRSKQDAMEFARLARLTPLTSESVQLIQEYLKPVLKPVEIVNFDEYSKPDFDIFFLDPAAGILTKVTIYSNPSFSSYTMPKIAAMGLRQGESWSDLFERYAQEMGKLFRKTIDLPIERLILAVTNRESKQVFGFIVLEPCDMENLIRIGVRSFGIFLEYSDPDKPVAHWRVNYERPSAYKYKPIR